jgi:hypothetical protein
MGRKDGLRVSIISPSKHKEEGCFVPSRSHFPVFSFGFFHTSDCPPALISGTLIVGLEMCPHRSGRGWESTVCIQKFFKIVQPFTARIERIIHRQNDLFL